MNSNVNFFNKRIAAFIFLITFLIYSPLLSNQYIGDDHYIIEVNTFYHSWRNIPRLVERGYILDTHKINFSTERFSDFGTGSVSYRPVSNFTYFLDYYFFQARPYGSHLINIFIHCINSVLVYWIVSWIFSSSVLGIFSSLFFSFHPIQSEAVAVMGYRADVLAAMFVLLSFYFWIKFKEGGYQKKGFYAVSLAMYFLGLFSKESAIVLPFMILLFDQIGDTPRVNLKQRGGFYAGFIAIVVLFLFLYTFIFPNVSLHLHWLGGSFINHCLMMGYIGYNYLVNIVFPWTVKAIPGLYSPPVPKMFSLLTAGIGTAVIAIILSVKELWCHYKKCSFFLLWYIIFYLPVSNLIPIANPMACRFMYLPSIGLLVVVSFFLLKVFECDFFKKYSFNLSGILCGLVLLICILQTVTLNRDWKNDFTVQSAWVRDYPQDGRGYALLGMQYFNAGLFEKSRVYLEKGDLLGDRMPREELTLAECDIHFGELEKAKVLLKQIILRYPDYRAAKDLLRKADQTA